MDWYPLKLSFHVRTYAFGERLIPTRLGKQGVPDGVVAETWEISDYKETTGTILNGDHQGRTLHDLVLANPYQLVGQGWRGPHFPLLEKFLDASHMLPVHLHADEETARSKYNRTARPRLGTSSGPLRVPPSSAGVRAEMTHQDLFDAFKDRDYDRAMPRLPIRTGETVYIPAGIIHSFGPDTLIFEVQQTSDLGANVMPNDLYNTPYPEETWEVNIRNTLSELRTHYQPRPHPGLPLEESVNRRVVGAAGPHFALERWTLNGAHVVPAHPERCTTLTNVGDPVLLDYQGGEEVLGRAESCILPAALGEVRVVPSGAGDLITCYLPNLDRDVIAPLQAAGHNDGAIRELGEVC